MLLLLLVVFTEIFGWLTVRPEVIPAGPDVLRSAANSAAQRWVSGYIFQVMVRKGIWHRDQTQIITNCYQDQKTQIGSYQDNTNNSEKGRKEGRKKRKKERKKEKERKRKKERKKEHLDSK
jgi:hypothetical protein